MSQGHRRLAAIMFTDMVGYTAMAQEDEDLSISLLGRQRRLIRPIMARHGGREVKTIGDGILVEFASALEAVNCAVEIQSLLEKANRSSPSERRIEVRIGIHLGDVVHLGKDVAGDAVNVASRIESLSPPGGVCVSSQVYHSVANKVSYEFESLGTPELKNVSMPMEVFRISGLGGPAVTPAQRSVPRRQRLAVLPFSNLSSDPADEYFSDGLTEELISTMSQIGGLGVIARTSVMAYKKKNKTIRDVARELGVGAVLEGSVRKAGARLRITVQLIDVKTSEHLWSQSYDRSMKDIFAVQSEISRTVAETLKVRLLSPEEDLVKREPTRSVEAYELYLKGLETAPWVKGYAKEDIERSREYFERAVGVDPEFALAHAGLEACYMEAFSYRSHEERFPRAKAAALRALEIDRNLAEAHLAYSDVLMHDYDLLGSEKEIKLALELKPNSAQAHIYLGALYVTFYRFGEAEAELQNARELDPLSPVIKDWIGAVLIKSRKLDRALHYLDEWVGHEETSDKHIVRADIYMLKGEYGEALAEAGRALALAEASENFHALSALAQALGRSGRRQEAAEILGRLKEKSKEMYTPPTSLAPIYLACGERDIALKVLEKAYEDHYDLLPWVVTSPVYDELGSDKRFNQLLGKMGLRSRKS